MHLEQVSFNGKVIDVLVLDKKTRRLIAVELKVDRWRKALQQAAACQLCATHTYVGLMDGVISDERVEAITRHGVGVIGFCVGTNGLVANLARPARVTGLVNGVYSGRMRRLFEAEN
jgi:hypothetical protein